MLACPDELLRLVPPALGCRSMRLLPGPVTRKRSCVDRPVVTPLTLVVRLVSFDAHPVTALTGMVTSPYLMTAESA